jgi:hypothetical protein
VAALLGIPRSHVSEGGGSSGYTVTVVIGADFTSGTTYGATTGGATKSTVPTASASKALSGIESRTGDQNICSNLPTPN